MCRVYSQGVITDCQVQNWFSELHSGDLSLTDESRQGCSSDLDGDQTNCISHSTNTLWKGVNPIILPPAMGK